MMAPIQEVREDTILELLDFVPPRSYQSENELLIAFLFSSGFFNSATYCLSVIKM
jgi:hypothetical protein